MKTLGLIVVGFLFSYCVVAQEVPPALFVRADPAAQKGTGVQPLTLQKVAVEARIFGHLAETRLTMVFSNPHGRVLAGDLYFPLPEGATISGYALDINGVLVDGVVVEKAKGRQVFEKIVRQGVDPGLIEWTKGNNFKTRVFPIPAHGTRTIMVKYVSELEHSAKSGTTYHLPLNFSKRVADFSLRVEVVKARTVPEILAGGLANFQFKQWRESFVAETQLEDLARTQDLVIALPDADTPRVLVEKASDGNVYFCVHDLPPVPDVVATTAPENIVLLWDASASRAKTDHSVELAVLQAYFSTFRGKTLGVDLVLFRNTAASAKRFEIRDGVSAELLAALKAVDYDGGTQMACISPDNAATKPDFYLLFSDGLSNFGKERASGFQRPLYAVSAGTSANHAFLRSLALETGGAYFNLKRICFAEVAAQLGRPAYAFIPGSPDTVGATALYPSIPQPVHGPFSLVGRLTAETAAITLRYGTGGKPTRRTPFTVSRADAVEGELLRRFWAQRKVAELLIAPKRNESEITATGKAHSLVTPGTSLIVLDSVEQYVEHEIAPPETLPKMREEYEARIAQRDKEKKAKEAEKLENILALWQKRVTWWDTEFKYPKDFKFEDKKAKRNVPAVEGDAFLGARLSAAPARPRGGPDSFGPPPSVGAPTPEPEDVVAETSAAGEALLDSAPGKQQGQSQGAQPAIVIQPWDPDTPYLRALKKAKPVERLAVYTKERAAHESAPAFFLDCADFLFKARQTELAVRVLSNVAELELENPALLRVLAHKLAQVELLDLSVLVFEEVLALRPEEPQSYRDLALVLARRAARKDADSVQRKADYARAIELLYRVVMDKWDRFAEIEVIALMELNSLIPRAKKAGVKEIPVDPRLVQLLDVDVRIVLTWDADMTDMDLWVTEPSGEKAFYSHPRTTIGGLVSKDFTRGYGPEEYCLKKAMNGVYKIEANYYGSSAAKLLGPVTLQADVFTNYGRANQQRKAITLRLKAKKETILVGEIEF